MAAPFAALLSAIAHRVRGFYVALGVYLIAGGALAIAGTVAFAAPLTPPRWLRPFGSAR